MKENTSAHQRPPGGLDTLNQRRSTMEYQPPSNAKPFEYHIVWFPDSETPCDLSAVRKTFHQAKRYVDGFNVDYGTVTIFQIIGATVEKLFERKYHGSHDDFVDQDFNQPIYQNHQQPPAEAYRQILPINIYLNALSDTIHKANAKWWTDTAGNRIERNKGELLALIHSEISEALEGERKNLMDDHLPNRRMAEVELADALIRILDYAAGFGYDIGGAVVDKLQYNATRPDHSHEARAQENGKKF